jgi:hypothetical protein
MSLTEKSWVEKSMSRDLRIREYQDTDEEEWTRCHALVYVGAPTSGNC